MNQLPINIVEFKTIKCIGYRIENNRIEYILEHEGTDAEGKSWVFQSVVPYGIKLDVGMEAGSKHAPKTIYGIPLSLFTPIGHNEYMGLWGKNFKTANWNLMYKIIDTLKEVITYDENLESGQRIECDYLLYDGWQYDE